MDFNGKKVLVVGLGLSGCSSAKLLAEKGALVKVSESEKSSELSERADELIGHEVQVELGGHTEEFCLEADLVVTSPGVDIAALKSSGIIKKGVPVIGELELGYLFCSLPIIAVTGTNGKSTTTELIGKIFSSSDRDVVVCGNIGNPLTGEVGKINGKDLLVVEVSSFQLETIEKFRPHVAVLLNVAEDHYERHGTFSKYKEEKFRIFSNQLEEDWAVVHESFRGDPMLSGVSSRILYFGKETDAVVTELESPIKGSHNLENIACASVVSGIYDIPPEVVREAVLSFKALAHRFELVASFKGIEFIDDSKATNVDATCRALESVEKKVVLIAGGKDKGGDYSPAGPLVADKVKSIVVIGEARERIEKALSSFTSVIRALDLPQAVKLAYSEAEEGEAVLLSPMCSSFDMFLSYKERGEVYQKAVQDLIEEEKVLPA